MTKRRLVLILAFLTLVEGPGHAAETHPFSVHDMLAMDRISDPAVSPDARSVAFTVRVTDLTANKGRTDIHLLDVATKAVRKLTSNEANDGSARFSPDGKLLYFLSTRSGSSQVYKLSFGGGEPEQVTKEPLDVENLEVSPDGSFLLISMAVVPGKTPAETKAIQEAKEKSKRSGMAFDNLLVRHWDTWKDGTRSHIFVYPLPSGPAKDLMSAMDADAPTKPFGDFSEVAMTADGKTLYFTARDVGREEAWSTNLDIFAVPTDGSSQPRKLTTNPATDTQPALSPDGKTLAYLSMSRPGYEADRYRVALRDLASSKDRYLDLRFDDSRFGDRSPSDLIWSADGSELFLSAWHLGQHALFALNVATGKSRVLVGSGAVVSPRLLGKDRILFGLNSLMAPTELYAIATSGGASDRLTSLNKDKLAAARLGSPEQFTFTGARNEKVYAYLVKPVDFDSARKYPIAFLIHGGPQGSFGNDFHYRWNPQAYAGAGYAAVMVDFHGSVGYGQAFTDAINGDWGGAPYEDLMRGLDAALAKYPFLDGTRAAALGGSYGGFMTNWINGQTDRFKCLVSHAGNLDERMAYFDTEELWFPEWEHGGLPWDPKSTYGKHNPIDHVHKWKTPTLVIHGVKDFRVVYTQGLSVFTALQRRGIPSKFLVFPDENHWILKPNNSIQWHETVLAWLDQWLKGGKATPR